MLGVAIQFGTNAETSLQSLGCRKHVTGRPNIPHPWGFLFLDVKRYSLTFGLLVGSVGHA